MSSQKNISLSKKAFYENLSQFSNKHTAIHINMPINEIIGDRFRILFYWRNESVNGKFDPLMSAQLLDMTKHGPKIYVAPDLYIDCIKENITTDYRLYKRLDKWVRESIEKYISEEIAHGKV